MGDNASLLYLLGLDDIVWHEILELVRSSEKLVDASVQYNLDLVGVAFYRVVDSVRNRDKNINKATVIL